MCMSVHQCMVHGTFIDEKDDGDEKLNDMIFEHI